MLVTGSNELMQDFEAGCEVLVGRYSLQNIAGGLQVQLEVEKGCAQVQALIDQEVALVKHQLLAEAPPIAPTAPAHGEPSHQSLQHGKAGDASPGSFRLMHKVHVICVVTSKATLAMECSHRSKCKRPAK